MLTYLSFRRCITIVQMKLFSEYEPLYRDSPYDHPLSNHSKSQQHKEKVLMKGPHRSSCCNHPCGHVIKISDIPCQFHTSKVSGETGRKLEVTVMWGPCLTTAISTVITKQHGQVFLGFMSTSLMIAIPIPTATVIWEIPVQKNDTFFIQEGDNKISKSTPIFAEI